MTKLIIVSLVVLLMSIFASCTPPSGWAIATDVSILADEASTIYVHDRDPGAIETNPVIGPHATIARVALDGALKIAVVHVANHYLPRRWKWAPAVAWMFIETAAVTINMNVAWVGATH